MEDPLAGAEPTSQFGRALGELEVERIPAHSPQATGRIERLFNHFQDRVIKEMRLAEVSTLEEANRFLERDLPIDNRRFSVQPAQPADLHRPRLARRDLDRILCVNTKRVLRRDWTVAHHGHLYQVQTHVRATHVMVEERITGSMRITHHGRALDSHVITARPVKAAEVTPRPDHPWRTRLRTERITQVPTGRA